jgi:hypothetical protein
VKVYEKVINTIAGIGFLALVPPGLAVFGISGPQAFLSGHLGFWSSATFLVLVFYGLTILRVLFGHAELYAPLLIGLVSSFLLMSAAVKLGFMGWYWGLARQVPFLADGPLAFLLALAVLGLAVLLSSLKKFPIVAELVILVVLPVAALVALHYLGVPDLATLLRLPPAPVEAP